MEELSDEIGYRIEVFASMMGGVRDKLLGRDHELWFNIKGGFLGKWTYTSLPGRLCDSEKNESHISR